MPIVGGLDIHRKQITFDYLDTVTGEVRRGQIAPADRAHVRAWLAWFAGQDAAAFAVEGCAGRRYVAEELATAGITAHLGEPADTAALRGRRRHAKTDKTDAAHLRTLLAEADCPNAGSRRRRSWSTGRCWRPTPTCAVRIPPRRSCAVFFHQGPPAERGSVAHRAGHRRAAGRRGRAPSPSGQLQVATALDMLAATEARMGPLRRQLRQATAHLVGAKVLAARHASLGRRSGDDQGKLSMFRG